MPPLSVSRQFVRKATNPLQTSSWKSSRRSRMLSPCKFFNYHKKACLHALSIPFTVLSKTCWCNTLCDLCLPRDATRDQMHLFLAGNNHHVTSVRLNDSDALLLFKTLCNNTYITSIDLRYNNITDAGVVYIAKLIEVSWHFLLKWHRR